MIVYETRSSKGNRLFILTVDITERVTLHYSLHGRTQTVGNKDRKRYLMLEKIFVFESLTDIKRNELPFKPLTDNFFSDFMETLNHE